MRGALPHRAGLPHGHPAPEAGLGAADRHRPGRRRRRSRAVRGRRGVGEAEHGARHQARRLVLDLSRASPRGGQVPRKAGVPDGRRRPPAQPGRRARDEHRARGRGEPRLEARLSARRARRARAARHLRARADRLRAAAGGHDRPGVHPRHRPRPARQGLADGHAGPRPPARLQAPGRAEGRIPAGFADRGRVPRRPAEPRSGGGRARGRPPALGGDRGGRQLRAAGHPRLAGPRPRRRDARLPRRDRGARAAAARSSLEQGGQGERAGSRCALPLCARTATSARPTAEPIPPCSTLTPGAGASAAWPPIDVSIGDIHRAANRRLAAAARRRSNRPGKRRRWPTRFDRRPGSVTLGAGPALRGRGSRGSFHLPDQRR